MGSRTFRGWGTNRPLAPASPPWGRPSMLAACAAAAATADSLSPPWLGPMLRGSRGAGAAPAGAGRGAAGGRIVAQGVREGGKGEEAGADAVTVWGVEGQVEGRRAAMFR